MASLKTVGGADDLDLGNITNERHITTAPVIPFDEPVTTFDKSASSTTTNTYLVRVFKPISRLTVTGEKIFSDVATARTFASNLKAFMGVGGSTTVFRYTGNIVSTLDGLLEDLSVEMPIGTYRVSFSFTMVEGALS